MSDGFEDFDQLMIDASENTVVEAWHDIAFPGWRSLPVLPMPLTSPNMKPNQEALSFIDTHYPAWAKAPGAPVRTLRMPGGTRDVPGRSPNGGYDLAALNI